MTCPVYMCTIALTGRVTFYKVPENTGNCLTGHPVYKSIWNRLHIFKQNTEGLEYPTIL